MAPIHKIVEGSGGRFLPFALSRERALRRSKIFTTQQFLVDGINISVKVLPGSSHIHIRGGEGWLAVPFYADLTLSGAYDRPFSAPAPSGFRDPPEEPAPPVLTICDFPTAFPDLSPYAIPGDPGPHPSCNLPPGYSDGRLTSQTDTGGFEPWGVANRDGSGPWGNVMQLPYAPVQEQRKYGNFLNQWNNATGIQNTTSLDAWGARTTATCSWAALPDQGPGVFNLAINTNTVMLSQAYGLRQAMETFWAQQAANFALGEACRDENLARTTAHMAAMAEYTTKYAEWLAEATVAGSATCAPHEGTKSSLRASFRATQLAKVQAQMRLGMGSPMVRSSVQSAMDYIPRRQPPALELVVVANRAENETSGTVTYLITAPATPEKPNPRARTEVGTWAATVSSSVLPTGQTATNRLNVRLVLNNVWAADLPTIGAQILPGVFTGTVSKQMTQISPEFLRGQMLSGVLEFHQELEGGLFSPVFDGLEDRLESTTLPEYRDYLNSTKETGGRATDDDSLMHDGLTALTFVIEFEVWDPFTNTRIWTAAPQIVLDDPIIAFDPASCSSFITPRVFDGDIRISGVRWSGTSVSRYAVNEETGVGSWSPGVFTEAEGTHVTFGEWGFRREDFASFPTSLTLFKGRVRESAPADSSSRDAYELDAAKTLVNNATAPPAGFSPSGGSAESIRALADWVTAQMLVWSESVKPPTE